MAKQYSALTKFTIALSAMHQPFILVGEGTTTQTVSMQSDTEKSRFVDFIFDGNGKLAFVDTGKNSKDGKHLYYCAGEMD
jgi:hypothetical protein